MYIAPNSTIILLKDVPLSRDYTDTIFFASAAAQTSYFQSAYVKKTFSAQSYQRVKKWVMRLEVLADEIYDYNYMMFQNTSFGSKWFYAFITNVEYLNNSVSEITYELDVMQTWLFEATVKPSYVERETPETDVIGANIAPEPIDIGPVKCYDYGRSGTMTNYKVILCIAEEATNTVIPTPSTNNSGSESSGSESNNSGGE